MCDKDRTEFMEEIHIKQCELLDQIRRELSILNKSLSDGKLINPMHMSSPDLKVREWVKYGAKLSKQIIDLSEDRQRSFETPDIINNQSMKSKFNTPNVFKNNKGPRFGHK